MTVQYVTLILDERLSDLAESPVAQPGQLAVSSVNGKTGPVELTAADASVPVTQTFPLANATYQVIYEWTVTGQADDPLPSFGLVTGSQTYWWPPASEDPVDTTEGPAMWFGVNPRHLSAWEGTSAHAALGVSAFTDAGDSWNPASGRHALEFNVVWLSPSAASAVADLEVVGGSMTRGGPGIVHVIALV